jgi:hypothetical protein
MAFDGSIPLIFLESWVFMKMKPFFPESTPYTEILHSRRRVSKFFSLGVVVEHQKRLMNDGKRLSLRMVIEAS